MLRSAGFRGIAASLSGTQGSPAETRGSVYFTARVAAKCLRNPGITAWITPPTEAVVTGPDGRAVRVEQFRPATFPTSRQTLFLLSKDGGGSAAPLVAALTDRVMRTATLCAERAGGPQQSDPSGRDRKRRTLWRATTWPCFARFGNGWQPSRRRRTPHR